MFISRKIWCLDLYIVVFVYFFLHLNDFNNKLYGFGKTIDFVFDNIKAIGKELKIFKHDDNGTLNIFQNHKTTKCIKLHIHSLQM